MANRVSSGSFSGGDAGEGAKGAARKASPVFEYLARFGHAAYGTVYLLVGILAARAAFGAGGESTGQEGALRAILAAPLGRVLLGVVASGLLGYAAWRVFQGVFDPDREGKGAKGAVKRVDHVLNGLFHGALAFSAGGVALGPGSSGGGSSDGWTAALLFRPFGVALVAAGPYGFYKVHKADFMRELKPGEMGARERAWARRGGRLGYAARGVVFGVIGVFLVQAALQSDADEARGLGGALEALARQPFGPYVLGATAVIAKGDQVVARFISGATVGAVAAGALTAGSGILPGAVVGGVVGVVTPEALSGISKSHNGHGSQD